jgi:PAS domain S-box-containing protein
MISSLEKLLNLHGGLAIMEKQTEQLKAKLKNLQRNNAELLLITNTVQMLANVQSTEQVIDKLLEFCISLTGAQKAYFLTNKNQSWKRQNGKSEILSSETYDTLVKLIKGRKFNEAIQFHGIQKNDLIGKVHNFSIIQISAEDSKRLIVIVNLPVIKNLHQYVELISKILTPFEIALKEKDYNRQLKELEDRTRKNASEISSIVDGIGDLLFVIDGNRVITKVNKAICDVFKKKPEEIVGRHCFEIVHGTEEPWCSCPATKTFETKQIATEEVNDPNLGIPLLITTSPILDEQGEVKQIIHIAKDITKIKQAEMEIHISANLFEAASDSIIVHDLTGKLVYFNEAAYKTRGYTRDEFESLSIQDIETLGNPRFFESQMRKLVEVGEATFETVNFRKDKTVMPVEIHAKIIDFDAQELVLSIVRDVSERKVAEEMLKKSEEEYSALFANMVDGFAYCQMIFDEVGKPVDFAYLQINDSFERITGLKREVVVGKNVTQAIPGIKEDNPELFEIYGRVAFTGKTEKFDVFFKPLSIWLRISVYCPRKGYFAAIFEDTTERKQAELQLKEAEEKHRTLLNVANVLVQSVDAEGKYIFVNEEWKKVLGYSDIDLKKITMMDVVRKDHLQYCMSIFKQVMDGSCVRNVETAFVTKDGREIVVSGNACPIFKDDKFVSTVAFFVDITERKKNEEKLKENSQRIELMVEKLRVVGSLTRHDVRNKLSTVTGYAYLLKKKHADEADIVEGLSKMEQSVKETVKIFEFAKMYEQLGAEELTYINVEAKLNEATTLFSGSLPEIINECHGLTVLADSFLRQLFYNFIDNTRKYGKKTTTIKVHCEKTQQDNLKLVYEDDGVGIPFENKPNLFHEGFSTGGSTGFGLFLTKKMIDVYGWTIAEDGEPGTGAKFTITIPKLNKNGKENFQIKP